MKTYIQPVAEEISLLVNQDINQQIHDTSTTAGGLTRERDFGAGNFDDEAVEDE